MFAVRSASTEPKGPAVHTPPLDVESGRPDETVSSAGVSILARLAWVAVLGLIAAALVAAAIVWR